MANEIPASQKVQGPQSDAEIRQKIIGTWVRGGYTSTNKLGSFSEVETLIYTTNGFYSATKTIISAGRTRVQKCQGFWSVEDHILTYSVTNSVGVKPHSNPFFDTQARIIRINGNRMLLIEELDQMVWFERAFPRGGM
jgi:hypothetical protein